MVTSWALLISSHICSSNLPAASLFCNSGLNNFLLCAWIFCFLQPSCFASIATFSCTFSSGYLEVLSGNISSTLGMCFVMWPYLWSLCDRGVSSAARPVFLLYRRTHLPRTLHSFGRRARVRPRRSFEAGYQLIYSVWITYAFVNIPASLSRLIVMALVSLAFVFCLSSAMSLASRVYLQNIYMRVAVPGETNLSTQVTTDTAVA